MSTLSASIPPTSQLHRLEQTAENTFNITHKKSFGQAPYSYILSSDEILSCLQFCWQMTFGEGGAHRANRSGGSVSRATITIFKDAFIGKIGEITFHKMCLARNRNPISAVDFECYGKGQWDTSDFVVTAPHRAFKIAVKTTKHFGNLLLLETKDWYVSDGKAIYHPNGEKDGYSDYIVFCRVKSNLYDKDVINDADLQTKNNLARLAQIIQATGEVVGYLTNQQLAQVINDKYVLPKGALLNGKIPMDAENYYVQSGSFCDFIKK